MLEYDKTDQYIHTLAQVLAKFGRSFVPKKADDSHTNLGFDSIGKTLYTHWVTLQSHEYSLVLDIFNKKINLVNRENKTIFNIDFIGKKVPEIESMIMHKLVDLGFATKGFMQPLHYQIPSYDLINQPFSSIDDIALEQWFEIRQLSHNACNWFLSHVKCSSSVRIWPHHFDTGVYVIPNRTLGFGFGLAMQDNLMDQAYIYCAGYGLNGNRLDYSKFSPLVYGKWVVTDNWKGAVLPISEMNLDSIKKTKMFIQVCVNNMYKKS